MPSTRSCERNEAQDTRYSCTSTSSSVSSLAARRTDSSVTAKAIGGVEGVLAVKVDYSTQSATVGTAADQSVPREAILAALKKISYSGEFTLVRGLGKSDSASVE